MRLTVLHFGSFASFWGAGYNVADKDFQIESAMNAPLFHTGCRSTQAFLVKPIFSKKKMRFENHHLRVCGSRMGMCEKTRTACLCLSYPGQRGTRQCMHPLYRVCAWIIDHIINACASALLVQWVGGCTGTATHSSQLGSTSIGPPGLTVHHAPPHRT